ncbi:MAG: dTDP-4-dehydrorhamnose 3,5-epimerase [Saprospiraceae bacterium]
MILSKSKIEGVFIIEPKVLKDSRGYFFESYNAHAYLQIGIEANFVQDNEAKSGYGVVRGLHFQKDEFAQAKLVRVSQGSVLDVFLDLRPESKTFGKYESILLSSRNKRQVFIPRGLAHGYSVLSKTAVFNYKCDNFYSLPHEAGINPMDLSLNIDWKIPKESIVLSKKDLSWPNIVTK